MKNLRLSSILLFTLTAVLTASLLGATPELAEPSSRASELEAATDRSAEAISEISSELTQPCGAQDPLYFLGGMVIAKPKPASICNCNPQNGAADCKRVCGDAGGECQVTVDCDDPVYYGTCDCNK